MRLALRLVAIAAVALVGCSKKDPSADEVCKKIVSAGVGANCRGAWPNRLAVGAVENVVFDLPTVAGKTASSEAGQAVMTGQVMRFDSEEKFVSTETAFANAGDTRAGPHRYGSKTALILVQANSGLGAAEGAKIRAVVDAL